MWWGWMIGLCLYDTREDRDWYVVGLDDWAMRIRYERRQRLICGGVRWLGYAYTIREKTETDMWWGWMTGLCVYDTREDRDWYVVGSDDWAMRIRYERRQRLICGGVRWLGYAYTIREDRDWYVVGSDDWAMLIRYERRQRLICGGVGWLGYAYTIREKTETDMWWGKMIRLCLYDTREDRDRYVVGSDD